MVWECITNTQDIIDIRKSDVKRESELHSLTFLCNYVLLFGPRLYAIFSEQGDALCGSVYRECNNSASLGTSWTLKWINDSTNLTTKASVSGGSRGLNFSQSFLFFFFFLYKSYGRTSLSFFRKGGAGKRSRFVFNWFYT